MRQDRRQFAKAALAGTAAALTGCGSGTREVVVYCALDREFAEPVLDAFSQSQGIAVRAKYDVESTKSVGLAELLLRERSRPRCDLHWNNEPLHTVRLADAGVLERFELREPDEFPAWSRAADGQWHGFAARLRVLLIHEKAAAGLPEPKFLDDLTQPAWHGKLGMAKPLFGTTATHVACLAAAWGKERTTRWLKALKANDMQILAGNKRVAVEVGAGNLAGGLTDTDDALAEIRAGKPVRIVHLEATGDGIGIAALPNTIAMVAGTAHPAAALHLAQWLLQPRIEDLLANGPSGQLPLHPRATAMSPVAIPAGAKRMELDLPGAAAAWPWVAELVKQEFASA